MLLFYNHFQTLVSFIIISWSPRWLTKYVTIKSAQVLISINRFRRTKCVCVHLLLSTYQKTYIVCYDVSIIVTYLTTVKFSEFGDITLIIKMILFPSLFVFPWRNVHSCRYITSCRWRVTHLDLCMALRRVAVTFLQSSRQYLS